MFETRTEYARPERQIRDLARAYRDLAAASTHLLSSGKEAEQIRLTEVRIEIVERILDLLGADDDEADEGE